MNGWLPLTVFAAYASGAVACAFAALWMLRSAPLAREDRWPAIGALALSANWCVAVAGLGSQAPAAAGTEIAAHCAWLFALYRLFANDGRDESLRALRPMVTVLFVVELLQVVILALTSSHLLHSEASAMATGHLLRMLGSVGALVLVHNLYAGASPASRALLRWNTAAMGGFWAFALNYHTVVYLAGSMPVELVPVRGAALAVCALVLSFGFTRSAGGLTFQPSRALTFRLLSLAVIGGYLGIMLAIAGSVNLLRGDAVHLTQVGLVAGAGALMLMWLPSDHTRRWVRATALRHLFRHRYDYRQEWLRFAATVSSDPAGRQSLQLRAIKALADLTDSPAGLLLTPGDDGVLTVVEDWRWAKGVNENDAIPVSFAKMVARDGAIVDLDAWRAAPPVGIEEPAVPSILWDEDAWAAVPLIHFGMVMGLVILARPHVARPLDWEDRDLLAIVGRQLASYLAERKGQDALAETRRFDEFNRRMAFVMHDIKNLSSQMALLAGNAERHAGNPAFQSDMLVTLRASADKLNRILRRLGRFADMPPEERQQVNLVDLTRAAVERTALSERISYVRCEPAVVVCHADALTQAIVHLLQNAVDASDPGASVMIDTYSDGLTGRIVVIDNGCGMTPEFVRSGLFRPFASTKEGGFGIGAYEARETVRAMGGRLDVESRPALGSRFTISLPLASISYHFANSLIVSRTEAA